MRKMNSTVSIKIEMDNGDLYELSRPSTIKNIKEHKPVIIMLTDGDVVEAEEVTFFRDYMEAKVNDSYTRVITENNVFGWAYKDDDKIENV